MVGLAASWYSGRERGRECCLEEVYKSKEMRKRKKKRKVSMFRQKEKTRRRRSDGRLLTRENLWILTFPAFLFILASISLSFSSLHFSSSIAARCAETDQIISRPDQRVDRNVEVKSPRKSPETRQSTSWMPSASTVIILYEFCHCCDSRRTTHLCGSFELVVAHHTNNPRCSGSRKQFLGTAQLGKQEGQAW